MGRVTGSVEGTGPGTVEIDDPGDERLADYAALTDAELRKRYEHDRGVLIAEGPNVVRALISSPYPLRSVLLVNDRQDELADIVVAAADAGAPVLVVSRALLYLLVRFPLHQGVLACGGRLPARDPAALITTSRRLLVLEGLNDHENLGALFRSARGLGIDGVLLGPGCADPLYRRSVRVSMGHVLHLSFARMDGIEPMLDALHAAGFTTVALTPAASATDLRELDLASSPRVALLLGAEGPGLSRAALEGATVRARIALRDDVDSLNVAAAAAIACHAVAPRSAH